MDSKSMQPGATPGLSAIKKLLTQHDFNDCKGYLKNVKHFIYMVNGNRREKSETC